MMIDRTRLHRLASLQNAVFTRSQAKAAGVTSRALERDEGAGRVKRILPNAYLISGCANNWEQAVIAAVMSAEQYAVASHQTAAYLWGLISARPPVIDITMHRWQRAVREYRVHESKDLIADHCTELRRIPITTPARTVVDLGATNPQLVPEALDAGLRLGRYQLADVARVVGRVARQGRRGIGTIKPLLLARLDWHGRSESEAEDLFRRVLDTGPIRYRSRLHNTRFGTNPARSFVVQTSLMSMFEYASRSTEIVTAAIVRPSVATANNRIKRSSSVGARSVTRGGTWWRLLIE